MSEQLERRQDQSKIIEKINEHDRHIDTLSQAIESLASTAGATNNKLDKVVDALSQQNVLIEKINNIDKTLVDSFQRRDDRLDALEKIQLGSGCATVKLAEGHITSLGRSIDALRASNKEDKVASNDRMKTLEDKVGTFVNGTVVRWSIGLIALAVGSFMAINTAEHNKIEDGYKKSVEKLETDTRKTSDKLSVKVDTNGETGHRLDKLAAEKIHMQRQINSNNVLRFEGIETFIHLKDTYEK